MHEEHIAALQHGVVKAATGCSIFSELVDDDPGEDNVLQHARQSIILTSDHDGDILGKFWP
jgi:hypothetical protein